MTWYRHALLALLAVALSAGCRTAGLGNLAQTTPATPPSDLQASELIKEHNRNAQLVQGLKADPSIDASMDGYRGGLHSHLALERPRNFKLDVFTPTTSVADIGSNESEFWFWVTSRNSQAEKAVYYCNHEDLAKTPLAATFQPDWIVEAMGLRVISEEEAAEIRVQRDAKPGRLILTHAPSRQGGTVFKRVTVLDERTHRILEHQLYAADGKTALARAVVVDGLYTEYKTPSADGPTAESVFLPARVKLEWIKEKLALDVRLNRVKVNPKFTPAQRAAIFVEPEKKEYARRNLAEMSSGLAGGPTTIRETRPAPPAGVRLGTPTPVGVDEARRAPRDPVALSADLPSLRSFRTELVAPTIPSPPEPEFLKAASPGWRNALPLGLEQ